MTTVQDVKAAGGGWIDWQRLTVSGFLINNEPPAFAGDRFIGRSVTRMLRGFFLAIVVLAAAGPAPAADDLELCRNRSRPARSAA